MSSFRVHGFIQENEENPEFGTVIVDPSYDSIQTFLLDSTAYFDINLDFGQDYIVTFVKDGFFPKKILIELTGVSSADIKAECVPNKWDINLIKRIPGVDEDMYSKPIGRIYYSSEKKCFGIDSQLLVERIKLAEKRAKEHRKREKQLAKADKIDDNLKELLIEELSTAHQVELDSMAKIIKDLSGQVRSSISAQRIIEQKVLQLGGKSRKLSDSLLQVEKKLSLRSKR